MTKKYLQQFIDEADKCKDPVYFYENHIRIDGKKPRPLTEAEKIYMRVMAGLIDPNARGGYNSPM